MADNEKKENEYPKMLYKGDPLKPGYEMRIVNSVEEEAELKGGKKEKEKEKDKEPAGGWPQGSNQGSQA